MTKLKLKDATKELLADATKVKEEASRARKGAENLLQSLRALENGFLKANEEKDAEMKRAEAEKQRADHSKAYVMLDAEERAAIEAAEKEAARVKAEAARKAEKAAAEKAAAEKAAAEKAAAEKAAAEKAAAEKAAAERAAVAAENSNEVSFTIGSTYIRKSEDAKLVTLAEWLKANPDFSVAVVGYADRETGTAKGNLDLSKRRAAAVAARLVKLGVDENRIASDYKGDTVQPFQVNDKNRVVLCTVK